MIAGLLDIPSVNVYMDVQDRMDGEYIAFCGDINRSLRGGNYFVTETTAQTTGWDSTGQFPPYDGQLRLAAFADVLSGADLVAYWHWHSLHYGQETYWKGVLAHDLEPGRVYGEVTRIASDFRRLGPELVHLKKKNRVAILFSLDSLHGLAAMPFDRTVDYMAILTQMYRSLYRLNVETDFVFPERGNFADYDLILVPPLYIADAGLLWRLSDYVKNGGHVLAAFKSGFADENATVRWTTAPGPLRAAAGFYYREFTSLRAPLKLRGDPFKAGEGNSVSTWAEYLVPETAEPLAFYDHPVFGKYPAVTRNRFGRGTLTYEGTVFSDRLQEAVVRGALESAGVPLDDAGLPAPVKAKHAMLAGGERVHAFFNFSDKPQTFAYRFPSGIDLLSGRTMNRTAAVTLPAWDMVIVKERGRGD